MPPAHRAGAIAAAGERAARALVTASVAARDGAEQITAARADVLARVAAARAEGFDVADDGSVSMRADPPPLLVALSGGDPGVARDMLTMRAAELSPQIVDALDRLGRRRCRRRRRHRGGLRVIAGPACRRDGSGRRVACQAADVVAGWPAMSQDRIADQIAAMTPDQRERLIAEFPRQVGNTDGVPWDMRVAANRVNIAAGDRRRARTIRIRAAYRLLSDPARRGRRSGRQRPTGRPADPCLRPRPGVTGGTQREPVDREERGGAGSRVEHHDRGFGGQHPDRSAVRLGDPR